MVPCFMFNASYKDVRLSGIPTYFSEFSHNNVPLGHQTRNRQRQLYCIYLILGRESGPTIAGSTQI
jgi:hypothetical protein